MPGNDNHSSLASLKEGDQSEDEVTAEPAHSTESSCEEEDYLASSPTALIPQYSIIENGVTIVDRPGPPQGVKPYKTVRNTSGKLQTAKKRLERVADFIRGKDSNISSDASTGNAFSRLFQSRASDDNRNVEK